MVFVIKNLPTVFGQVEGNATFLLDISGSMYLTLDVIKEHLIELLSQRAGKSDDRFNVVAFSSDVRPWSNRQVPISMENVVLSTQWINQLSIRVGPSNLLDALLFAFSDAGATSVYLVTDGLPDSNLNTIIHHAKTASRRRPIHILYMTQGRNTSQTAENFLQNLAVCTRGSLRHVALTFDGNIDRVTVLSELDKSISPSASECHLCEEKNLSCANRSPSLHHPVHDQEWGTCRHRIKSSICKLPSSAAAAFIIGTEVLARRKTDGYYAKGLVTAEADQGKFYVSFSSTPNLSVTNEGQNYSKLQETLLCDLISLSDATRHSITIGDYVLAPLSPSNLRYGPARVLQGSECRNYLDGDMFASKEPILVAFSSGQTLRINQGESVWISKELHQRIESELSLPFQERNVLMKSVHYPQGEPYNFKEVNSGVEDFDSWKTLIEQRYNQDCFDCMSRSRRSHHCDCRQCCCLKEKETVVVNCMPAAVDGRVLEKFDELRIRDEEERARFLNSRFRASSAPESRECWEDRIARDIYAPKRFEGDDFEYDPLLCDDVRHWGLAKDVATETDIDLVLYKPANSSVHGRAPWRYWSTRHREASPNSQPKWKVPYEDYSAARHIYLQDTSGYGGSFSNYASRLTNANGSTSQVEEVDVVENPDAVSTPKLSEALYNSTKLSENNISSKSNTFAEPESHVPSKEHSMYLEEKLAPSEAHDPQPQTSQIPSHYNSCEDYIANQYRRNHVAYHWQLEAERFNRDGLASNAYHNVKRRDYNSQYAKARANERKGQALRESFQKKADDQSLNLRAEMLG